MLSRREAEAPGDFFSVGPWSVANSLFVQPWQDPLLKDRLDQDGHHLLKYLESAEFPVLVFMPGAQAARLHPSPKPMTIGLGRVRASQANTGFKLNSEVGSNAVFPGNANLPIGIPCFLRIISPNGESLSQGRKRANREIGVPGAGAGSRSLCQTIFNFGFQV
jgi:hypothetical protein